MLKLLGPVIAIKTRNLITLLPNSHIVIPTYNIRSKTYVGHMTSLCIPIFHLSSFPSRQASEPIDENGNWTLENSRQRLNQYCQVNQYPCEVIYSEEGQPGSRVSYSYVLCSIYVIQWFVMLLSRNTDYSISKHTKKIICLCNRRKSMLYCSALTGYVLLYLKVVGTALIFTYSQWIRN